MSDEAKKILVDDDWKAQARREKERLAEQEKQQPGPHDMPEAGFPEILNIVVMQAMAAMGMLTGPRGERMPPDLPAAKHFIDLLQVLEDKTKGNLSPQEKSLLDQVLYETRMIFVQLASAGGAMPPMPGDAVGEGGGPAGGGLLQPGR